MNTLEYSQNYGKILKKYREKAGISVDDLAERLGCWNRYIPLWEKGLQLPFNKWHKALTEQLGICGDDADIIMQPRPEITLYEEDIKIDGLEREYRILQLTDAHVIVPDEDAPKGRLEYEIPRISDFSEDGITARERMELMKQYISTAELDGVVMTGDIIDCPFDSSIAYLKELAEWLPVPYVYVFGNHDWRHADCAQLSDAERTDRPKFNFITDNDAPVIKRKIGELTFIGLDNTRGYYADGIADALRESLCGEKNVFVLQHLPFAIDTLAEDYALWWHGGETQNGTECDPYSENRAVRAVITEGETPVRAVIAGDIHFFHKDVLEGGIPQYTGFYAAGSGATLFKIHG